MLLLHVELPARAAFLLSIERREARRTDSCVILCRRPASEWRSLREHRTEVRCELCTSPAIAILAAVRPGDGSCFLASSADKRSDEEMLTTTSGVGTLAWDWAVPGESSRLTALLTLAFLSTSSSAASSGFVFSTSSVFPLLWGEWLTSSVTSGFVCLFFRVVRLGCVVVLSWEVEAPGRGSSSAMKFSDLTDEPRRLLRRPFENLGRGGIFIQSYGGKTWQNCSTLKKCLFDRTAVKTKLTNLRFGWLLSSWRPTDTRFLRLFFFCDGVFGINSGSALKSLKYNRRALLVRTILEMCNSGCQIHSCSFQIMWGHYLKLTLRTCGWLLVGSPQAKPYGHYQCHWWILVFCHQTFAWGNVQMIVRSSWWRPGAKIEQLKPGQVETGWEWKVSVHCFISMTEWTWEISPFSLFMC